MYINTHCNYSQPTLIKLDNENIGGHLTPLHLQCLVDVHYHDRELQSNLDISKFRGTAC